MPTRWTISPMLRSHALRDYGRIHRRWVFYPPGTTPEEDLPMSFTPGEDPALRTAVRIGGHHGFFVSRSRTYIHGNLAGTPSRSQLDMHDVTVASEPPPPTGGIRTIRVPLRDFLVPSVPLLMESALQRDT
ncbi:hypothetical protein ACRE_002950 [Hapsidospora chrysogenum ATCC 11550]|uniref:Uncharacterized protein n=1 Tax=Hapsidospora chrysogenum (strain ATCC 11550 / CBS 779.69 / DSM 880 / IAM 14645 / JCM 23072 / IMI 49137) TaxID=857340 RepID=A0A086TH65_HAPC1|nr:hypothetical protein ACRE_002950 [Hapsidospora chrysogenum ATCC 11550]